ncbi:hypothetical protein, partial [Puniceicoccus vermicola]
DMQRRRMKFIALIVFLLPCVSFANEFLKLKKIEGLEENETIRFLADWRDTHPEKELFEVSKGFMIPKGPSYIDVIFNSMWDGKKARYSASMIRIPLKKKIYQGEMLSSEPERIDEVAFVYLKGSRASVNPSLTQKDCMVLRDELQKVREAEFEGTRIPFSLIQPLITEIYSPEAGLYIMKLGSAATYSSESYHLVVKAKEGETTAELRHRTNLAIP